MKFRIAGLKLRRRAEGPQIGIFWVAQIIIVIVVVARPVPASTKTDPGTGCPSLGGAKQAVTSNQQPREIFRCA